MQKRTILVTGCSDESLGSALALALHRQGWRVVASARNTSKLSAVKAAGIEYVQLDVASDQSISSAVDEVKRLTGDSLDGLINNAGKAYSMPVLDMDLEQVRDVFELNVFSVIKVTKAFAPLLLKSTRNPILVNNASGAGLLGCGAPMQGGYNASKAALIALTEALRLELAPFSVRVIDLITGGVNSTFFDNGNNPELPPDSIYNVAKAAIEGPMGGNRPGMNKMSAATWAMQVAKDLSQNKPPHMVYRGLCPV